MQRSRTGRLLVALLVMAIVIVGAVVLVGELWIRPAVEREIGNAVADEFALSSRPDVRLRGFPLVLHALQEQVDGVDISVDGEIFEGMRVESVDLRVDDVEFTTSELLGGGGIVQIAGGDGAATITDIDLSEYLVGQGLGIEVRFENGAVRASGPVTHSGITADAAVEGNLVLDGAVLRFTPTTVDAGAFNDAGDIGAIEAAVAAQFTFQAPVPVLEGVRLTEVSIGDGIASVAAVFESLDIRL